MQIVSIGDNLHETSNPVVFFFFLRKLEKYFNKSFAGNFTLSAKR